MKDNITVDILFHEIEKYIHNKENLALIHKAYDFALSQHVDQFRKSGEPYIIHPLSVTYILATLRVGPNTLVAGLLHDVVEDTYITLEDVTNEFNEDVASIVDGVTKVGKLKLSSLEKRQVQNHQKMLIAMSKDIRVIIVKLADRLHNIRTLSFMSDEAKIRIATETLEIYAPLAHRLGMFKIKAELEDISLKYVNSEMYNKITNLIYNKRTQRDNLLDKMIEE
ncbi:MAG: HD domain-containing protein, partial [Anaeroplasmataceae bacterium]